MFLDIRAAFAKGSMAPSTPRLQNSSHSCIMCPTWQMAWCAQSQSSWHWSYKRRPSWYGYQFSLRTCCCCVFVFIMCVSCVSWETKGNASGRWTHHRSISVKRDGFLSEKPKERDSQLWTPWWIDKFDNSISTLHCCIAFHPPAFVNAGCCFCCCWIVLPAKTPTTHRERLVAKIAHLHTSLTFSSSSSLRHHHVGTFSSTWPCMAPTLHSMTNIDVTDRVV